MPAPTPVMTILLILVPLAALVCLLLAGLFLYVQFTFSYRKKPYQLKLEEKTLVKLMKY